MDIHCHRIRFKLLIIPKTLPIHDRIHLNHCVHPFVTSDNSGGGHGGGIHGGCGGGCGGYYCYCQVS
jgi:hypothetical protein